jgi:ubiquinone/menaquinone biosynthesis C-methylase UbiE
MNRYNTTAAGYDELYGEEQQRKYQKALEHAPTRGKAVLDVGCGSGLFFSHIAGQAEHVVGVDVSFELLRKAKLHSKGFENVEVVLADADHLPFKEGVFGAVFAFTVLQNMPKPLGTLDEFKRVTEVGARVVVTGLKKAFTLTEFMDIVEDCGLALAAFIDEQEINCYIAALTA